MMRGKRPLELADANSQGGNKRQDSKDVERSSKKPKSSLKSFEAALARARDVCSSMIPAAHTRKKTIDQSIFAKGTIERVHHEAEHQTITFFLLSNDTSCEEYAEVPVVIKGPWVNAHLANGALAENHSIILAFKEGRIGTGRTEQGTPIVNAAPFEVYLLFERGIEFWVITKLLSTAVASDDSSNWRHFKLFAQAQYESAKLLLDSGSHSEIPTPRDNAIAGNPPSSSVSAKSDNTIAGARASSPLQVTHQLHLERELSPRPGQSSPSTAITQIETGTPSQLGGSQNYAFQAGLTNVKGLEFETVSSLRKPGLAHRDVNVIGVVIEDSGRAVQTSGGTSVTIRLVDPSAHFTNADEWQDGTWLGVTYLDSSKKFFPNVQTGDVLLIRSAKTVSYKTYTRLSVFSDQMCDWVCLPAEAMRGLPEANLFNPIHADAFRTCPGAERPDEVEQNRMRKLALWARAQIIRSSPNTRALASRTQGVDNRGDLPTAGEREALSHSRLFRDLRIAPGIKESETFDIVCKIVGQVWQAATYIAFHVTDYTSNATSSLEAAFPEPDNNLKSDMILRVLLWQNDASHELVNKTLATLKTEGAVLLFRGLRVRHVGCALHANGRLNKPEFKVVPLTATDLQGVSFVQRQIDYMEKLRVSQKDDGAEAIDPGKPHRKFFPVATVQPATGKAVELTRLAALRAPVNLHDSSAFFNCACEIVEDVYIDEMRSMTIVALTDFSCNEQFWQNMAHPVYPRSRSVFKITIFGAAQRAKVAGLRQGDRVVLWNVRCKLDKQGNLEGHVGERSTFRVDQLTTKDVEYGLLENSRAACLSDVPAGADETPDPAPHVGPSTTTGDVACKFVEHPVSDEIMRPLLLECEKMFRVRGRVIDYNPKDFDAFLVSKCTACDRHLARDERLCRECENGIIGDAIARQWCFSLRIELEPGGCNIEFDAVEMKRAFWIAVIESEGETIFMNGLEPVEESMEEAARLLLQIVDNPSEGNRTNPIFDFCVKKMAGQRVLLLCDTALCRNDVKLPWKQEI